MFIWDRFRSTLTRPYTGRRGGVRESYNWRATPYFLLISLICRRVTSRNLVNMPISKIDPKLSQNNTDVYSMRIRIYWTNVFIQHTEVYASGAKLVMGQPSQQLELLLTTPHWIIPNSPRQYHYL